MTLLSIRPAARADIKRAAVYYRHEAGVAVQDRWLSAVEQAFAHLRDHPHSGSRRLVAYVRHEDLSSWVIRDFPYLVIYRDREEGVEVVRLLHTHRDIPTILREPDA